MQVKLLLDAVQVSALAATLRSCNESADWVSRVAFGHRVFREYALRKHAYAELKARGLGAQSAQHVIKKVADAYAALHAAIRAGNLGRPGSKRRVKSGARRTRLGLKGRPSRPNLQDQGVDRLLAKWNAGMTKPDAR
ncbi:hypothetical protein LX88_003973 [Lentzea californiensis]|nr:hypothetical protein [Lentzea californiensis]